MKMSRKVCIMLLFVLVSTFLLASCHGAKDHDPFAVPDGFDLTQKYEIVFWAKNEKNIKQTKVYQQAIKDFEEIYPNIKVTLKLYSDYKVIYRDVITNIPTQTTPNVCITYPDHIATYMTGQNIIVPLDELIYDEKYGLGGSEIAFDAPTVEEIIPEFLAEGVIGGVQYALPYMRSTEALYYNKTYVEALGFEIPEVITWDFVWEVSKAATEKIAVTDEDGKEKQVYKINGQSIMYPFVYKSTDNMMIQMLKQYGGGYSTEDGEIQIFNDTTKEILYTVAENTDVGAFNTFAEVSYPADLLNRGQCIFAIDSTAGSVWVGKEGPLSTVELDEAADFELGISEIPQVSADVQPQMISQGPSICIFNKEDNGEVLASWIFAQYLLTNEVQIAYSQTEGYVPVTSKAHNSEEYLDYLSRAGELDEDGDNYLYYAPKIEVTKMLLRNIDNTFITPVFNGSTNLRNAAGEMIELVVDAKIAKQKQTVDDAYIEGVYDKMISLYHLDGMGNNGELSETLPEFSVILIFSMVGIWGVIIAYVLYDFLKKSKAKNKNRDLS